MKKTFGFIFAIMLVTLFMSAFSIVYAESINVGNIRYNFDGNNIITNGSFEDSSGNFSNTGWYTANKTDGTLIGNPFSNNHFYAVTGAYYVNNNASTTVNTQIPDGSWCLGTRWNDGLNGLCSIRTSWAIEAGKSYYFSYWTKNDGRLGDTVITSLTNVAYPTAVGTVQRKGGVYSNWTKVEYIFTASETTGYSYLTFWAYYLGAGGSVNAGLNSGAGPYWYFDNFVLREVSVDTSAQELDVKVKVQDNQGNPLAADTILTGIYQGTNYTYKNKMPFIIQDNNTIYVYDKDKSKLSFNYTEGTDSYDIILVYEPADFTKSYMATVPVDADSYIQNTATTVNYGSADTILATSTSSPAAAGADRDVFLKFDLSSYHIASIESAAINMHVVSATNNATRAVSVYSTSDGWTETGITYDNAPARGASAIASANVTYSYFGSFVATLSSTYLSGEEDFNVLSFRVGASTAATQFASKENTNIGVTAPALTISFHIKPWFTEQETHILSSSTNKLTVSYSVYNNYLDSQPQPLIIGGLFSDNGNGISQLYDVQIDSTKVLTLGQYTQYTLTFDMPTDVTLTNPYVKIFAWSLLDKQRPLKKQYFISNVTNNTVE